MQYESVDKISRRMSLSCRFQLLYNFRISKARRACREQKLRRLAAICFMQGQMLGEGGLPEAMATIFVWLRYSSSRQLTWQRNYNTQPRILGDAQARLTNAIAQVRTPPPKLDPDLPSCRKQ